METTWSVSLPTHPICVNRAILLTLGRRVTVVVLSFINPRPEGYGSRFVILSICQQRYREQRSLLRAS